jgi:hypothetical protein
MSCSAGADCTFTCPGGNCTFRCQGATNCTTSCGDHDNCTKSPSPGGDGPRPGGD